MSSAPLHRRGLAFDPSDLALAAEGPRWLAPLDLSETVAAFSRDQFGAHPAGVWAAPGRVNLMGEHTDYNQGWALPAALPHRTFVAVRPRTDDGLRMVSLDAPGMRWEGSIDDVAPGRIDGWAAYPGGVVWALTQEGLRCPGLDIAVAGTVPLRAGLASSAALSGAVALAVAEVAGAATDDTGRERLARACARAEASVARSITGGLDQAVALRSLPGRAMLLDCRTGAASYVPLGLRDFDGTTSTSLMVIDTGVPSGMANPVAQVRRRECNTAASLLGVTALRDIDLLDAAIADLHLASRSSESATLAKRITHVVSEIGRVHQVAAALARNDLRTVGELFCESHESLRDDFEVSCDELDMAVEAAVEAGALGARMTGAGMGGSVVVLVEDARRQEVAETVWEAFAAQGYTLPTMIEAPAAAAAARVV